jgi:hypothetical protein
VKLVDHIVRIFSLVLGALTYWVGAGPYSGSWVMAGLGAALVLDGAWRLKRFYDTHPKVEAPSR